MTSSTLLNLYIVTFNCGRELVDPESFAAQILRPYKTLEQLPDLIVLCLEEIAPLAHSFLGGSFVAPYFRRIIAVVRAAAAEHSYVYRNVFVRNIGLTGLIILAKEDIASRVSHIESAEVGVGRSETGNKGAVAARFLYRPEEVDDSVSLTFVAAHLYPFEEGVEKRNLDWKNIVRGLVFTRVNQKTVLGRRAVEDENIESRPLLQEENSEHIATSTQPSGIFQADSLLFFAGDLNYRTSDTSPDSKAHLAFPQPTVNRTDPRHFSHLLVHDQLGREREAGRTLHGLSEASIDFPPTYKYSAKQQKRAAKVAISNSGEDSSWSWSAHRWPSWCDRILFSSFLSQPQSPLSILSYGSLACQPTSDHRPVSLVCQLELDGVTRSRLTSSSASTQTAPPFELNARWAEDRAAARTKEVVIGTFAYLAWTWEGHGLLLATLGGAVGGWLIMRYLVATA